MKISYNWLKKYIDVNLTPEAMDDLLTGCGLEVESFEEIESVKGGLRGLVIGEVMQREKHPDADRLSVTQVNVGKPELAQIVCGAANVAKGQKVLVALPGAKLFPTFGEPFDIKKSKIRGQASEGMICSEDEVGLGKSHEGIMVLDASAIPGTPAAEYFKIEEDIVFEIGLTPNRSDAASHIGVARDMVAVINTRSKFEDDFSHAKVNLNLPDVSAFKTSNRKSNITVSVEDAAACPRYSGVSIAGVKVQESPAWLKNHLLAIGIKPISNIVDITNFVMWETGQPLHAFDASKIKGNKVVVKKLKKETAFIMLDSTERKLTGEELMICNEQEPMCIAGVFGGLHSGISETTTELFLESAYFNPADVRKAAKLHSLKTDSSFRFERGTDPRNTVYALKRAALLIKEIAAGEILADVIDVYPTPIEPKQFPVSFKNIRSLSGIDMADDTIAEIISNCGMNIISRSDDELVISVATYKTDVTREADVVEEILRTYGYHHIPFPDKINISFSTHKADTKLSMQKKISHYLAGNGFYEILKNSLTSSAHLQKFLPEENSAVKILNPLSNELDIMRTTLLFPALEAVQYNVNRKNANLRLFEFGKTYHKTEAGFNELNKISIIATGDAHEPNWHKQNQKASFFLLKSFVENVAGLFAPGLNERLKLVPSENTLFADYAEVQVKQIAIGYIGSVKKAVLKNFDIANEVFYAELDMEAIMKRASTMKHDIAAAPKFPEVKRDLSMVLDANVKYSDIKELALKQDKKLLRDVSIFDVYEGDKIEQGKKSYALSFVLRDDESTLTDKQIDGVMAKLESVFEKNLGAVIRR